MGFLDLSDNVPRKQMNFNADTWNTQDFDNMEGHEFEHYCANVLRQNNFERVEVTRGSGDQGVDIIAYKDGLKYAIQCKNYSSHLGNTPVQEVFAGKTFYKCDVAVVMTNQTFTQGAIDLANATGVLLWDRYKLMNMIDHCTAQNNTNYGGAYMDYYFDSMKKNRQSQASKMFSSNTSNNALPLSLLIIACILILMFVFIFGLSSFNDLAMAL